MHKAHAATFKNEKHKAQWLASLKADVFPLLGHMGVSAIQASDVLKVLSPIWTTKPETICPSAPVSVLFGSLSCASNIAEKLSAAEVWVMMVSGMVRVDAHG